MSAPQTPIHGAAVAVALDPDGPLEGALILGPSGCGKSALALSLIEACPWGRTALVADDVVVAVRRGDAIIARAPQGIAGVIEIRGFGPARARAVSESRLIAAFELSLSPERLPEPKIWTLGDARGLSLWPFHPGGDAPARMRAILRSVLGGQIDWRAHHSESASAS